MHSLTKATTLIYLDEEQTTLWSEAASTHSHLIEQFSKTLLQLQNEDNIHICAHDSVKNLFKGIFSTKTIEYSHEIKCAVKLLENAENLLLFYGIYPLLDKGLTEKIFKIHAKYNADYSYGENLPPGISPVILSQSLFKAPGFDSVPESLDKPLSKFVESNINKFHVEVHYEEPDLRMLRLDFSCATPRSLHETGEILSHIDANNIYQSISKSIHTNPKLVFNHPTYIELEITTSSDQITAYSPRRVIDLEEAELSLSEIDKINEYVSSTFSDTSVCLGGLGEPLQHSNVTEVINKFLQNKDLNLLLLETNGAQLDSVLDSIDYSNFSKMRIIVMINSLEKYERLHGKNSLTAVRENLKKLQTKLTSINEEFLKHVYIQTLKVVDNETEIDTLYDLADSHGFSFLLQKYNRYIDLLPEKRVSDMTPLKRSSCWHLRRDLYIMADGSVAFCKQDIQKTHSKGNIKHEDITEIFSKQEEHFVDNFNKRYSYMNCAQCDEYFTFNL